MYCVILALVGMQENALLQGFWLADWRVEPLKGLLTAPDGSRRHVAPKAMEVLVCLARRPGEAVNRATIFAEVWGDAPQSHEALTHVISELRHALADKPAAPVFLQTLPRRGYRLIAAVDAAQSTPQTTQPSGGEAPEGPFLRRYIDDLRARKVFRTLLGYPVLAWLLLQVIDVLWEYFLQPLGAPAWLVPTFVVILALGYPVAVFLSWAVDLSTEGVRLTDDEAGIERYGSLLMVGAPALLLTAVALFVYFNAYDVPSAAPKDAYNSIRTAPIAKSIAVLRFLNMSDTPGIDYLSDGLTEELIHELTNLKTIKVASRTSVWSLPTSELEAPDIAERLQVEQILEGSVRSDGEQIRVTAQLIDNTGFHVWTQAYDRPLEDILSVQKDIARKVADELDLLLTDDVKDRLSTKTNVSSETYDKYLQGRQLLRQPSTQANLNAAAARFNAAIEIDRRFPLAYAGLCETNLARYRFTRDTTHFQEAEFACHRALTLDGGLADVYTALGNLYRQSGQHDKAEQEFLTALEINPMLEEANYGLARSYEAQGRLEEAEVALRRSLELEPGYWGTYFGYGNFLHRQGQYAAAVPYYETVTEMEPNYAGGYVNLGSALHWLGRWDEAERAWLRSIELGEDAVGFENMGTLYYYRHEFEDAVAMHRRAVELAPMDHRPRGKLAAALRYLPDGQTESLAAYRQAIALAEEQLIINPDYAEDLYLLGAYLVNIGQLRGASRSIERALTLAPQSPDAHYFAAILELNRQNIDKALAELATAGKLGYSYKLMAADPELESLRQHPEYLPMLEAENQ